MGQPEKSQKTGDNAVAGLYTATLDDEESNIKIKVVANTVVQITPWSKMLTWYWEEL